MKGFPHTVGEEDLRLDALKRIKRTVSLYSHHSSPKYLIRDPLSLQFSHRRQWVWEETPHFPAMWDTVNKVYYCLTSLGILKCASQLRSREELGEQGTEVENYQRDTDSTTALQTPSESPPMSQWECFTWKSPQLSQTHSMLCGHCQCISPPYDLLSMHAPESSKYKPL